MLRLVLVAAFTLLLTVAAQAETKDRKPAGSADGRSTLEFDEKVVEGMGAKDLSSARHTGENRTRKGEGLVREKTDFHDEMKRSLREVPWVQ